MRRPAADTPVRDRLRAFVRNESGATAIEYGLIVSLISLIVILAITSVGQSLWTTMSKVSTAIAGHS